ncbi:hypothetical protein ABH940_001576 [Streptacidiphilus sp. BW17]
MIRSPHGTPWMWAQIGSSSRILPSSTSSSSAVTVNVLVSLPIRMNRSVAIGAPVAVSETPVARV